MTAVVRRETREKGNEDMKRKDKIPCVFKKKKKKLKGNILCCCSLRILHQRMEFCIEIERLKGWKKSKIKQQQNKTKKKKKKSIPAHFCCALNALKEDRPMLKVELGCLASVFLLFL